MLCWCRVYATDYLALFGLLIALCISEISTPFQKHIYHSQEFDKGYSDAELWRYSYPLHANTERVPAWAVPVVSFLGPAAVLTAYKFVFKPSRLEFHNLLLGLGGSVLSTALFTNFVKLTVRVLRRDWLHLLLVCTPIKALCVQAKLRCSAQVGRPRPNFLKRCWPDGATPVFDAEGRAVCSANAVDAVSEGRKSFPSGGSAPAEPICVNHT